MGTAFLTSNVEFYQTCGLPRGVGLALKCLADQVKEGKHSDQTAGRKRKVDEIDALEPSISPKRSCPADLLELAAEASERRKYIKEIITDINGSSNQYSNSVESANPLPGAVDQLSDPTFERTLPFPFIGSEVPVRFKVVEGTWQYVGRTKFKELLQELKKVRESDVYSTVWLYGTQGYGKSHLLAALVCYLAAQDERVVYISGCQALLNYPVKYLRATMLFAWADDITIQKLIITLNTLEDIGEFFESQKNVIFIIDQMDTLKINGSGEKGKRENLSDWIKRFTFGHKKVYSSSANDADYYEQAQNQYQSSMLPVYAGLTKMEMDQWWKRHSDIDMGSYEQHDVEYVMGRIPLLLDKCVVGQRIDLTVKDLRDIYDKAAGFVQRTRAKTMGNLLEWNWYVKYVTACFCHARIPTGWTEHPDLIDHRYFYELGGLVNPMCGLVRCAVADQLLDQGISDFLPSLPLVIDDPSITGFMVEHAVLSSIHSNGLPIGAELGTSMELRLLKDPTDFGKGATDKPVLYRPESFNFKAMDGIIVLIKPDKLNDEKNTKKMKKNAKKLLMFPLQITVAPATHANCREIFFKEYGKWITNLPQFDVEVQFLWISPECRKSQEYPASLEPKWPKHLERYIPLKDINKGIWQKYEYAQKRLLKTQASAKMPAKGGTS